MRRATSGPSSVRQRMSWANFSETARGLQRPCGPTSVMNRERWTPINDRRPPADSWNAHSGMLRPYPCVGFAGLDEMTASRAAGEEGESPPRHAPLDDWRSGRSGPRPGTGTPPRGRTKPSVRESRDDVGGGSGGGLSSEPGPAIEVAVGRLLVGGQESTPAAVAGQ